METVNGHAGKGVQARGCRQGGAGRGVQAGGCRQGGAGKGVQARGRAPRSAVGCPTMLVPLEPKA